MASETDTMKNLICLLFGHDWHCLFRHRFAGNPDTGHVGSEVTGWACFRCGANRDEQWDA